MTLRNSCPGPLLIASEGTTAKTLAPIPLPPLGDRPLVSVLVANYNYEKYLGAAIESVLAQSYTHWELIVCDDGSTDDSIAVLARYADQDRRIRLLSKENGGHGPALNAAYRVAQGDVICLLDSDDVFLPGKIEKTIGCLRERPQAGFAIHRLIRTNERGQRQGVWPLSHALPEGWLGPATLAQGGVVPYLPPTSGITLRRGVAEALFPMPERRPLAICPDQVIMRLAPLVSAIAAVDEPLAEYRLHGSNSYGSGRTDAAFLEREITICEQLWEAQRNFLAELDPDLARQLTPVGNSSYLLYLRYLWSRLARDPSMPERHTEFMADLRRQERPRLLRFWQCSRFLPLPVFDLAVNTMSRQSWWKQLLARLRGMV